MTRTAHTVTNVEKEHIKGRGTVPRREETMALQVYGEQRTGGEERREKRGLHKDTPLRHQDK